MDNIKDELKEYNIKSEFYFKNKKPKNIYSIVPVSSKTKEGLSDLLALLVYISQFIPWLTASSSVKPTNEICGCENTAQGTLSYSKNLFLFPNSLSANAWPSPKATGVKFILSVTSPIAKTVSIFVLEFSFTTIDLSYTMGGATLGISQSEITNDSSTQGDDTKETIFAIALAF